MGAEFEMRQLLILVREVVEKMEVSQAKRDFSSSLQYYLFTSEGHFPDLTPPKFVSF